MANIFTRTPFLARPFPGNGLRVLCARRSNIARDLMHVELAVPRPGIAGGTSSAFGERNFPRAAAPTAACAIKARERTERVRSNRPPRPAGRPSRLARRTRSSHPSPLRCCGPRKWPWQSSAGAGRPAATFANGSIPLENSKRYARWRATATSIPPMFSRSWSDISQWLVRSRRHWRIR